ncbi:MAG: TonB-dependent receptor [Polyangiaceae bacterium]|nr:TonB-dependent receptor [Polyangiaceae bacterium]
MVAAVGPARNGWRAGTLATLAAGGLLLVAPAAAQERGTQDAVAQDPGAETPGAQPPDGRALPAVPPPASVLRRLREIVARGGARPSPLPDDPTAFTTVLRAADYDGEATTTDELLGRAPGVQLRRFGGPGAPTEVSIRGSTASQVVVAFDGIRLDTAQSGHADPSTVPLAFLDRIEVARGGGSAQAGSNAIGGVVDLVPLRPGGPSRTRSTGTRGAYDTWQGSLTRTGTAAGFDYALGYDGFRTDGDWEFDRLPRLTGFGLVLPVPERAERINNEAERHATLATLARSFGEHAQLTVRDHLFYQSRGVPGLDDGSNAQAGQRAEAHERSVRHLALARLDAAEIGGTPVGARLELAHLWERQRFRDPEPVARLGRAVDVDDRNATLTLRGGLDAEHDLGPLHQRVSASLEHRRDALDAPDFGDPSRETFAWLVQDDLSLLEGRVRLAPALRWEDTEGFGGRWIPRAGLLVEPLPGLRLRANLERAYRAPSFDELYFPDQGFLRGNPGLAPEESTDGDVGVELAWDRLGPLSALRLEAVWFHRDIDDSIVWVLVSPSLVEPHNTGPASAKGWELTGSLRLFDWVELSANHTRLDTELDATGTPLPGRAERETNLRLAVGPPSGAARVIVERQEVSEIPVTPTGSTLLPERTTWDATLWVDLAHLPRLRERLPLDSLRLGFEVANLSDELVRDAEYFPQPGRTWLVHLEGHW